jgi:hypothetical protein
MTFSQAEEPIKEKLGFSYLHPWFLSPTMDVTCCSLEQVGEMFNKYDWRTLAEGDTHVSVCTVYPKI